MEKDGCDVSTSSFGGFKSAISCVRRRGGGGGGEKSIGHAEKKKTKEEKSLFIAGRLVKDAGPIHVVILFKRRRRKKKEGEEEEEGKTLLEAIEGGRRERRPARPWGGQADASSQ